MPISFGLTSNLSIDQNLSVGGTAAITSTLTLSSTTASSLLYSNASKVVSSVTLSPNFSLTDGTLALAAAFTGVNSITSVAGQNLVLALGTGGTALTLANSTRAATFAGNSISMAGGSSWTDSSGTATLTGGSSGASLVLGSGASGSALVTPGGVAGFLRVSKSMPSTSQFTSTGSLQLINTDTTDGNWNSLDFSDSIGGGTAAGIYAKHTDHANDYAELHLVTRGAGGLASRGIFTSAGTLLLGTTTQPASLTGGVSIVASGSGATATGVQTGGLQSANFGLSTVSGGASYFGGAATFAGAVTHTLGTDYPPQTAPASPASGWVLYTDSGDGNKLKAKASTGTVVTIGTP